MDWINACKDIKEEIGEAEILSYFIFLYFVHTVGGIW
jgi:hypothetical protein